MFIQELELGKVLSIIVLESVHVVIVDCVDTRRSKHFTSFSSPDFDALNWSKWITALSVLLVRPVGPDGRSALI